jgi:hypothetical protein
MSSLKENGMSNGEALAVVNKFITINPEPKNFPPVFRLLQGFFTHFWFSKVELNKMEGYKV